MKSPWMLGLIAIAGAVAGWLIGAVLLALISVSPPPVSASAGTVERRIHLKMESTFDTDKPRTFICRESP